MNIKIHFALLLLVSPTLLYGQIPDGKEVVSNLEIYNIETGQHRIIYSDTGRFEAPNWSPDNHLIFNQQGLLYSIPIEGGTPEKIETGFADRCNNDHGLSADGKMLAISHNEHSSGNSIIYTLPAEGSIEPVQITPLGPSYWHGWSPDSKYLAYCAERNGNYDVYSISSKGGKEKRLTTANGLDDGPDYSFDGKYIYFNSVRTGTMQIWRMKTNGKNQTQLTFDELNSWFPHPSPNNKKIVFISYISKVNPGDHPAYKDVVLRMMDIETGKVEELVRLFGGQGTINVPSWSPDSKEFAYVSYTLIDK
ncbi:MAG: transporter [Cyclobacteriaceae bacterium]|nr:transporter [Cyclobacteriaceae bacterium]